MKRLLKSVAAGIVGMGLFFCFFMLVSIPLLALRESGAALQTPGAVTAPTLWFRHIGLPLSAVAFALSFVAGWKKFSSVHQ